MNGSGVFVRDLDSDTTARVDVDANGNPADSTPYYGVSLSDGGRVVAFWSGATNLAASSGLIVHDRDSDENGTFDESGGMTNDDALSAGLFPSVSGNGQVVFDYYGGMLLDRAAGGADPDTLTVNKIGDTDDGACTTSHCTLREAINRANALAGTQHDFIRPRRPGRHSGPVHDPAGLGATDDHRRSGHRRDDRARFRRRAGGRGFDGTDAGAGVSGLVISAGGSTVRGLVVNRFGQAGIVLQTGDGNLVAGNYVGIDATGSLDRGNTAVGIHVMSSGNTIGGATAGDRNVVAGTNGPQIAIEGPSAAQPCRGTWSSAITWARTPPEPQ